MLRAALMGMAVMLWVAPAAAQSRPTASPRSAQVADVEPSAWIGVGLRGGSGARGVPLASIYPGTPAADAGLLTGDEIVAVNGIKVHSSADLIGVVKRYAAGETVRLLVFRDGKRQRMRVRLAQKPTRSELAQRQLINKPVPSMNTQSAGGGVDSLSAMRGDVVVVAFVSSSCLGCETALRELERLRRERGHGDLRIVGIGMESRLATVALSRRLGLRFPFLVGLSAGDASAFGWTDTRAPLLIVVDRGGIVRYAGTVDDHIRPSEAQREAQMLVERAALVAERVLGRRSRRAAR